MISTSSATAIPRPPSTAPSTNVLGVLALLPTRATSTPVLPPTTTSSPSSSSLTMVRPSSPPESTPIITDASLEWTHC